MQARDAHILTLTVDNEFGVLTRITAQIRREGWNIKSLAAEETADRSISRITLALQCFDSTLPSVVSRLSRLACVRHVSAYDAARCICRELTIARTADTPEMRAVAERFGAQVIVAEGGCLCSLERNQGRLTNSLQHLLPAARSRPPARAPSRWKKNEPADFCRIQYRTAAI